MRISGTEPSSVILSDLFDTLRFSDSNSGSPPVKMNANKRTLFED